MGNTNSLGKGHGEHRTFSPVLTEAGGGTSTRELSSSRPSDDGFEGPKTKLLLSQHSTDYSNDTDDVFRGRVRATTIVNSTINESALPTVFKWEGGGKDVYITGTFSDWKPIRMCHSHGDFVAIVDVPEGKHEYKYIVDGTEKTNKDSPKDEATDNNVIHVKKSDFEVFEALAMDLASNSGKEEKNKNNPNSSSFVSGSPPGRYGQELPSHMKDSPQHSAQSTSSGSGPPILPPHLLQVILNNPNVSSGDSTLLPQPNHVMLNHLYALSIKDGVMVLSCTHRYRKKYVTTLLYKPI